MNKDKLLDTMQAMTEEISLIESIPDYQNSDAGRRLLIRTSFSLLEAFGCVIRERAMHLLLSRLSDEGAINIQQAHFLDDFGYSLSETGMIQKKNRSDYPFLSHLAFSIRSLAELAGHTDPIIQGPGWDKLKKSVKVRNRITHPKKPEDIVISDDEFAAVNEGIVWAMSICVEAMQNSPFFTTDNLENT